MTVTWDKEGHYYIMIKGSVQQEDLMALGIYAGDTEAPKYIKQTVPDVREYY